MNIIIFFVFMFNINYVEIIQGLKKGFLQLKTFLLLFVCDVANFYNLVYMGWIDGSENRVLFIELRTHELGTWLLDCFCSP